MSDLVQWLGAQLDEDEAIAIRAAEMGPWALGDSPDDDPKAVYQGEYGSTLIECPRPADAAHVARQNPARVLREIDVKRQLLDLHAPGEMDYVDGDVCMACDVRGGEPFYPCKTLRLLALPYADRPGYDAERWGL
ncbi:DUF6221 family protein [Streptomyces sp. N35]|uniref:DUF6221 family protein n=1 Tax=Streptomyces sp. N35 TaxID=2795730 RepID=UPI0018F5EE4F|nr:DUF6221 family protein [Streptomyces sp. N35]